MWYDTSYALYGASDTINQSYAVTAFPLCFLESEEETDVLQLRQKCTEKHFKVHVQITLL